jgi:hypothetical protein
MSDVLCFIASLVSRTPTTEVCYLGLHIHRVKEENETKTESFGCRLSLSVSKKKKKKKKGGKIDLRVFYRVQKLDPRQGGKLDPRCSTKEKS